MFYSTFQNRVYKVFYNEKLRNNYVKQNKLDIFPFDIYGGMKDEERMAFILLFQALWVKNPPAGQIEDELKACTLTHAMVL